ncbi:hypothetical protein D3C73_869110 [compost metagenome]
MAVFNANVVVQHIADFGGIPVMNAERIVGAIVDDIDILENDVFYVGRQHLITDLESVACIFVPDC